MLLHENSDMAVDPAEVDEPLSRCDMCDEHVPESELADVAELRLCLDCAADAGAEDEVGS